MKRVRVSTRWGVQATFWVNMVSWFADPDYGKWKITNVNKITRGGIKVARKDCPPEVLEQKGKLFVTEAEAIAYVEGLQWGTV